MRVDTFAGRFSIEFANLVKEHRRCVQRMQALGFQYGDMPAHDILWRTAQQSSDDLTARQALPLHLAVSSVSSRLALVPMSQEARGLDAGPRLAHRLFSLKDRFSAKLVQQIAKEERAHVAVGLDHFLKILQILDQDPGAAFRGWIRHLCPELANGRFDHAARRAVGLPQSWYAFEAKRSLLLTY